MSDAAGIPFQWASSPHPADAALCGRYDTTLMYARRDSMASIASIDAAVTDLDSPPLTPTLPKPSFHDVLGRGESQVVQEARDCAAQALEPSATCTAHAALFVDDDEDSDDDDDVDGNSASSLDSDASGDPFTVHDSAAAVSARRRRRRGRKRSLPQRAGRAALYVAAAPIAAAYLVALALTTPLRKA